MFYHIFHKRNEIEHEILTEIILLDNKGVRDPFALKFHSLIQLQSEFRAKGSFIRCNVWLQYLLAQKMECYLQFSDFVHMVQLWFVCTAIELHIAITQNGCETHLYVTSHTPMHHMQGELHDLK